MVCLAVQVTRVQVRLSQMTLELRSGDALLAEQTCTWHAGITLRDVTEAVGLIANERTLACACLADCPAVQVMRKGMHLFSVKPAFTPEQSEPSLTYPMLGSRVTLTLKL